MMQLLRRQRMLDPVMLFRRFGVIPPVHGTYQITGDPPDTLKSRHTSLLKTAAARALVANDAGIAAYRIPVHGMVDGTVADASILHAANNFFKGLQILGGVTVHLNVTDMARIRQSMIGGLQRNLLEGGDGKVHGDMKTIGVVFPVCDTGQNAKSLLVQF